MEKSKRARPSGGKHLGYFRELSFIKGVFYPEDVWRVKHIKVSSEKRINMHSISGIYRNLCCFHIKVCASFSCLSGNKMKSALKLSCVPPLLAAARVAPPLPRVGVRRDKDNLVSSCIRSGLVQGGRSSKKPEGGRGTQAEPTSQSPGVAASCPSAQSTPLPSQCPTFWARWRTATGGSGLWIPQRLASAPTDNRRSLRPVFSISSSTTSSHICTITTCLHPPLPQPPPLWDPVGPITSPTECRSFPAASATAASETSESCRPTRRRSGAEQQPGTATRSPDTRQVSPASDKISCWDVEF